MMRYELAERSFLDAWALIFAAAAGTCNTCGSSRPTGLDTTTAVANRPSAKVARQAHTAAQRIRLESDREE